MAGGQTTQDGLNFIAGFLTGRGLQFVPEPEV